MEVKNFHLHFYQYTSIFVCKKRLQLTAFCRARKTNILPVERTLK